MRPALALSARKAQSSTCLLKHCCSRSMFSPSPNTIPKATHRPLFLWFLVNKSYSTLALSETRTLNHRKLGQNEDLESVLASIETSNLTPKGIFKFLRVALYNIKQRDADKAWLIYQTMVHYNVDKFLKTNHYGYLLGILKYGDVSHVLSVLEKIEDGDHTFQVLFAMSKQGLVKECCEFVNRIEPTPSHYHSLAVALRNARKKDPDQVKQVVQIMLDGMQHKQIVLEPSTVSIMLSLLGNRQDNLILEFIKATDHRPSTYNVYMYTSLIAGFARQGDSTSAKRLFDEMQKYNVKPNKVTYSAMMEAYSRAGEFDAAQELLKDYKKRYTQLNNPMVTSLLVNAIKHQNLPVAESIAKVIRRKIKASDRDAILRTALLWLKARTDVESARKEFDRMYKYEPALVNDIMANHLVEGLGKKKEKERVLDIMEKMKKRKGPRSQHYFANALFHCRDVSAALSIFGTMRANSIPDDITIAMVIQGLVMNNEGDLAWRLFKTLQAQDIEPNLHAYSSMLKVFGHTDVQRKDSDIDSKILDAAGIHAHVDYVHFSPSTEALSMFRRMTGFQQPNAYTYTTLIACFAKTNITQAIRIFDHMRENNVDPTAETYTALLQGCAMYRNSQMATIIFKHMCDQQVKPNKTTWRYLLKSLLRGRVDRKEIDKIGDMARKAMASSV